MLASGGSARRVTDNICVSRERRVWRTTHYRGISKSNDLWIPENTSSYGERIYAMEFLRFEIYGGMDLLK